MSDKTLIRIQENWPLWLRICANFFNWIAVFAFFIVMYSIWVMVSNNPGIHGRINQYLGLVGVSSSLGILTMIAGTSLIIKLNPWLNFKNLLDGDGHAKIAGSIIFASIVLSLSIIIMASN